MVNPKLKAVANYLTISRFVFAGAVFLALYWGEFVVALVLYTTGLATDFLDGRLARYQGATSPFGWSMDSTADKVLVVMTMSGFVHAGQLSILFLVTLLFRELIIFGLRGIRSYNETVAGIDNKLGRIRFVLLYIGIFLLFAGVLVERKEVLALATVLMGVSIFASYIAACYYIYRDWNVLRATMRHGGE